MDSPGNSLNSSATDPFSSPDSSVDRSLLQKSLFRPKLREGQTIRSESGKFKGYSLRAYEPEAAGGMLDLNLGIPETMEYDCPIANREVVNLAGVGPGGWFEDADYKELISLIDQYSHLPREVTARREERIALLDRMEKVADTYLAKRSTDKTKREFVQSWIKDKIPQERRLLFGIPHAHGKIFMPEDELQAHENFAHGNSASIAKVFYKREAPDKPTFKAVFKASTSSQEVTSEAARNFGIKGNSETAKLSQRSVFFYEFDQLMGMNLTPPTFYAIHNGQPGSCQEFVEGVHVTSREHVRESYNEMEADLVPGVVRGEYLDQGRGFRLLNHSEYAETQLAKLPDHELIKLFREKEIYLTREQVVDLPPLDLRHPKTQKALANAQLLDHLAGSVDRNLSNIFFVKKIDEFGQVYYEIALIDNDLCAAPGSVHDNEEAHSFTNPFRRNMAGRVPKFIDRETARAIRKLSFEEVFELLGVHQLANLEELASQRERMSNAIIAINRALRSDDKKAEVVYRNVVTEKFQVESSDKDGAPTYETASDVIEVKEVIEVVDHWDDHTYQRSMEDTDTYLYRANDCRVSELSTMMDSAPAKAAEIWKAQFHLMGGCHMAQSLGKEPVVRIGKLQAFLKQHQVVECRTPADFKRVVDFANTIVSTPKQLLSSTEQKECADQIIGLMLGKTATAEEIGKTLKFNPHLSAHTIMEMYPQAIASAQLHAAEEWKPARAFKTKFKFMNVEGDHPPIEQRRALAECLNGAHPDTGSYNLLRFWSLLNTCTVPAYMEKNKKLDIVACREFAHAMSFITPSVLKQIQSAPSRDRKTIIKQVCFTPVEDLNPANVNAVINLLYHHFGSIEPKNR